MKKILYIIPFLLTSCFTQQKAVQQTREKRIVIENPTYLENDEILPQNNRIVEINNVPVPAESTETNINYFSENPKVNTLLNTAYSYLGTPYRHAGTTREGMDCSGFVSTTYQSVDVRLSRSSTDMANQGVEIPLSKVILGDLLFFKTSRCC